MTVTKERRDQTVATIELKDITHFYGDQQALRDVNLMMETPKTYGLIGRNGAGKTTLLSLLAAYKNVQQGELRVFGETPYENPGVLREVSYHGKPDYEEEDDYVWDYFDFYKRYRPKFDKAYALRMAEEFDLPLKKAINKLSQGQQSALNGILGLACHTAVTIFDEVYLGMDAPSRTQFYREVLQQQMENPRLMILSTHLVSEMEYLFDHVLMMDKGKMIIDEPSDEVLERGFAITGEKSGVEALTEGFTVLHREELGSTQKAIVYGNRERVEEESLQTFNLTISPVSLQDLFIHLTDTKTSTGNLSAKGSESNGS